MPNARCISPSRRRRLAVEMHENWLEAMWYLNMEHLQGHKKETLRALALRAYG